MNRVLAAVLAVAVIAAVAVYFILADGQKQDPAPQTAAAPASPSAPAASAPASGTATPAQPAPSAGTKVETEADDDGKPSGDEAARAVKVSPVSDDNGPSGKPAADTVQEQAGDVVAEAGKAVTEAVEDVGDKVREAGKALSRAAGSATKEVSRAGEEVAKAVGADEVVKEAVREREKSSGAADAAAAAVKRQDTGNEESDADGKSLDASGNTSESPAETAAAPEPAPKAKEAETQVAALPAMLPPSFDVVRISNKDCTAVLAGRAEPGSSVTLLADGSPLAVIAADGAGEWAHLVHDPLSPGAVNLTLEAELDGRVAVSESDLVLIVPDCQERKESDTAVALLAPKSGGGSRLLQSPEPQPDAELPRGLDVGKVDYDDAGKISLSGTSEPGREIRIYVDEKLVGRATAGDDGTWQIRPEREISPGLHVLRVDQVDEAGKVLARVELPFARARPGVLNLTEDQIVVQPGNSLWRIARRTYGQGVQYSVIYQANADRIRDPDLIYPGQVFRLPAAGPAAD